MSTNTAETGNGLYVVKSEAGYLLDEATWEMTTDVDEAKRFPLGYASYYADGLRESGLGVDVVDPNCPKLSEKLKVTTPEKGGRP